MQAQDIMTAKVISVAPSSTVEQVTQLMIKHHISALPVVDEAGVVQGIVSEGDLMRRVEGANDRPKSWWLRMVSSREDTAQDFVALRGRHVEDVMTKKVISVEPDMQVGEVARLLAEKHIKRVPVVKDGKLLGIVSRANLMHALAATPKREIKRDATDLEKRSIILEALSEVPDLNINHLNVIVEGNQVDVWGVASSQAEEKAVKVAVENIAGIENVTYNLGRLPGYAWGI